MMSLNKIFSLSILTFFITNIWIVSYVSLLTIFNFVSPPLLQEKFYRQGAAAPEPFEIPIFLLLTHLFVMGIILFKRTSFDIRVPLFKLAALIILSLIFVSKMGTFPLALKHYPYELRSDQFLYTLTLFFYLASIVLIIFEAVIIQKMIKTTRFGLALFYIGIAIFIGFMVFEPRFPIGTHEYAYFFGPLYEVLQGKTLFTQIQSNYGFYSILFFAALAKIGLFSYAHLPIYIWFLYIIQYFLCFYIIFKVSKSTTLALLGLFSIITVNYFSMFVLPIILIQYAAIRRLPAIFLIFLAVKNNKVDSPLFLILTSLTSFLIIDAGVSTVLAVLSTLFIFLINKTISFRSFIKSVGVLFLSLVTLFGIINLIHLLAGYKMIDYMLLFSPLRDHAINGLVMVPLSYHTFFWLVMLIYFASVLLWVRTKYHILLLSAQLTLFTSLYFVGRSDDTNLLDISVVALLALFLLLAYSWKNITFLKWRIVLSILIFFAFILYPAYQRRFTLTELIVQKYERLLKGDIMIPEMEKEIKTRFSQQVNLIKQHISSSETLILARDDTYLFMLTGKKNLLDVNPQSAIETGSSMRFAIKRAIKICPKKMVVECTIFEKCKAFTPYTVKSDLVARPILSEIETACKMTYEPVICDNQLCIVEARKR